MHTCNMYISAEPYLNGKKESTVNRTESMHLSTNLIVPQKKPFESRMKECVGPNYLPNSNWEHIWG